MHAFWNDKLPRDVLTSFECVTYDFEVGVRLVSLADLVIFSGTPDEHIDHFRHVLIILYDAVVTLNLLKCYHFTNGFDYLCHVICPGSLKVLTRTTDDIGKLEHQTNVTGLRSFLILRNVFRRWVQYFTSLAALLNEQLHKGQLQIITD